MFARKNYFYPDLPKGYQISQYEQPLALGGGLEIRTNGRREAPGSSRASTTKYVRLTRIHMEEDAGKSLHEGFPDSDRRTYLDYNRAGVPLIEIVSEPDMRTAEEAAAFFEKLRQIVVWLGVNDGNMEEGSLRCDANVSIRRAGETALGTKAEVKNVNSFRYLQKALEYEIERQIDVVEHGGRVVQETRLFDSAQGRTYSMRSKEEAHDYRYFPEPDLPPLVVDEARRHAIAAALPELPEARMTRFVSDYGLPEYDANLLTQSRGLADYFEATARLAGQPQGGKQLDHGRAPADDERAERRDRAGAADARRARRPDSDRRSRHDQQHASPRTCSQKMYETGRSADDIVKADGLAQIDDEDALVGIVNEAIAENPDAVEQFRKGRGNAFGFLVGHVMKASKGKANPKVVNEMLRRALEAAQQKP